MRFLLPGFLFFQLAIVPVYAQSEIKSIEATITQLFTAMENGDSTLARQVFSRQVNIATIKIDQQDKAVISRETSISPFIKAIGTPHPDKWHEEIWDLKIEVDGKFAQVWCDYAFYRGNAFSHCGVDAFQLIKEDSGWKIFNLADTRRKTGCEIPVSIQNKYK